MIAPASLFGGDSKAYWYLTRSTGVVALVLLTAIVILGTLSPMRIPGSPRWPRFAVGRLHRDLSLLVLVFLAIHIVTAVLDTFAPIGWLDAVIPLHSSYRPLWLGFGALAFDLLLALTITSLVRRRLGYERWRAIHWLAYASWPVAVLHGLGSGSDTASAWSLALTTACTAAVLIAIVVRVARAEHATGEFKGRWIAAALATPAGLAAFALWGPLQSGWATRAGTPAKILHPTAVLVASAPAVSTRASVSAASRPRAFRERLRGTERSRAATGGAVVDLALSFGGPSRGVLRVRLAGTPLPGGGLSLIGSQVDLAAPALGPVLAGSVVSLSGETFDAKVSGGGAAYTLRAALQIDAGSGVVTGTLRGTPVTP